MSIAFDTSNRIETSGFICGLSCMIFESPEKNRPMAVVDGGGGGGGDQRVSAKVVVVNDDKNKNNKNDDDDDDCCSSSSIGRNSDSGGSNSDGDDDGEVQSSYKGPLDTLDALEEVLPIRRGISKFYSGKSKSFTSLADATSSSIKEIAKPENAYTRKRKNLLATSILLEKNHNNPLRSVGGISKRRTFNLSGTPTSSSESITSENSNTSSSSPPRRPPLHPQTKPSFGNVGMSQTNFSSRRAYSLADLQIAQDNHSSSISNSDESKKHH